MLENEKRIIELLEEQNKKLDRIINLLSSSSKKEIKSSKIRAKKTGKKASVYSLIEDLKHDNFFDNPRSLKDIQKELKTLNYHYELTSLTNPLQRLVRQKVLGRILQKGKWAYVKR